MDQVFNYKFYLMHLNDKVVEFDVSVFEGCVNVERISKVHSAELLPLSLRENDSTEELVYKIDGWLKSRCIPNGRSNFINMSPSLLGVNGRYLDRMYNKQHVLMFLSYGVSLSDKYWINPVEPILFTIGMDESTLTEVVIEPKCYEQINYYQNGFTDDLSRIIYLQENGGIEIKEYHSPDICTNGILRKRWEKRKGFFVLRKHMLSRTEMHEDVEFNGEVKSITLNSLESSWPSVVPEEFYKEQLTTLQKLDSRIVPKFRFELDEYNQHSLVTRCLTNLRTEIIPGEEVLLYANNNFGDPNKVKEACWDLGCNLYDIKLIEEIMKRKTKPNWYENFGLLRDAQTGVILHPVVWSVI